MAFPLDAAALATLDSIDLGALRVAVTPDLGGVLVSQSIRRTFADRVARKVKAARAVRPGERKRPVHLGEPA